MKKTKFDYSNLVSIAVLEKCDEDEDKYSVDDFGLCFDD